MWYKAQRCACDESNPEFVAIADEIVDDLGPSLVFKFNGVCYEVSTSSELISDTTGLDVINNTFNLTFFDTCTDCCAPPDPADCGDLNDLGETCSTSYLVNFSFDIQPAGTTPPLANDCNTVSVSGSILVTQTTVGGFRWENERTNTTVAGTATCTIQNGRVYVPSCTIKCDEIPGGGGHTWEIVFPIHTNSFVSGTERFEMGFRATAAATGTMFCPSEFSYAQSFQNNGGGFDGTIVSNFSVSVS